MQPLGAPMNDYHGVIAAPGEAPSLEEAARLLGASRLNVTAWVGDTALGEDRRTVQVELGDGGYGGWYAERRAAQGKFFKDKERARRSMEAELGPLRVERGLRDPALLDWLIELKRDQYRRTARHDIFACGWTAELLHALLKAEADGFGASMAGLWAGDRLTALEYSLHAGDQYHFWFPGYEPSLARCSPGIPAEHGHHADGVGGRLSAPSTSVSRVSTTRNTSATARTSFAKPLSSGRGSELPSARPPSAP